MLTMTQPPHTTNTTAAATAAATTADNPQTAAEQDLDQLAHKTLSGDLSALTTLTRLNLDLSQAATIAVQAALKITDDTRATFAQMPSIFFDPKHLANLETHARAARYVTRKLRQARVLGDADTRLPEALVDTSTTQRTRMLRVADYNLSDQETVARQLAAIRSGHGYNDLANDLDDLADLYETHAQTLSRDLVHYRPDDAQQARILARQIIEQLDLQRRSDITHWTDQQSRIWTLLSKSYGEVQRTARYIWPDNKDIADNFPPLRVVTPASNTDKP